jgi:antitoxin component YwqK of YwqJK toxin-antitoxin module
MIFRLVLLMALAAGLSAAAPVDQKAWFEKTKATILRQSKMNADSVGQQLSDDLVRRTEMSYREGHLYLKKIYRQNILVQVAYFDQSGEFELRRELCPNGKSRFEGIYVRAEAYGICTWYFCSGKIEKQGVRYRGKDVGIWKFYDENGRVTEEVDFENQQLVGEMPVIR